MALLAEDHEILILFVAVKIPIHNFVLHLTHVLYICIYTHTYTYIHIYIKSHMHRVGKHLKKLEILFFSTPEV